MKDGKLDLTNNRLAVGDNLELLKLLPDNSIDLIYMDPPFNSNRNYIAVDENQVNYFKDIWKGDHFTYLEFLFDRLLIMKQKLKDTGSLYLHCDPSWSHYIKVMMDRVFGQNNFRNEIVWCYSGTGKPSSTFKNKHDIILWYTKTSKYTFTIQTEMPTNPNTLKRYDKIDSEGKVYKNFTTRGITRKVYLEPAPLSDWWNINVIGATSKERVNYPTQKPLALLERIIKASSNEGDIVLDPFMGSGTTLVAAHNLKRKFVGFDISPSALLTTKARLDAVNADYTQFQLVWNYDDIRKMEPFAFEKLIVEKLGGIPNSKQRGDMGIDGRIIDNPKALIQVKRSDNIGRNVVDNFCSAIRREGLTHGIIVAFSFGKGAEAEASRLRQEDNINIELKLVKDIININLPPKLTLTMYVDSVIAKAEDPDGDIVNYTWWTDTPQNSVPEVLRDKTGKFEVPKGTKKVWCRVTDDKNSSTIESIEVTT